MLAWLQSCCLGLWHKYISGGSKQDHQPRQHHRVNVLIHPGHPEVERVELEQLDWWSWRRLKPHPRDFFSSSASWLEMKNLWDRNKKSSWSNSTCSTSGLGFKDFSDYSFQIIYKLLLQKPLPVPPLHPGMGEFVRRLSRQKSKLRFGIHFYTSMWISLYSSCPSSSKFGESSSPSSCENTRVC